MVTTVTFLFVDQYNSDYGDHVYQAQEIRQGQTFEEAYARTIGQFENLQHYALKETSFVLYEDQTGTLIPSDALIEEYQHKAEGSELHVAVLAPNKGRIVLQVHLNDQKFARLRPDQYQELQKALWVFPQLEEIIKEKAYDQFMINGTVIDFSDVFNAQLQHLAETQGSRKLTIVFKGQKGEKNGTFSKEQQEIKPQQSNPKSVEIKKEHSMHNSQDSKRQVEVKEQNKGASPALKVKQKVETKDGQNDMIQLAIQYLTGAGHSQTMMFSVNIKDRWEDALPRILKELQDSGFPWVQEWDFKDRDRLEIEYQQQVLSSHIIGKRIEDYLTRGSSVHYLKFFMRYLGG